MNLFIDLKKKKNYLVGDFLYENRNGQILQMSFN
jgi:hypothetical protein